MSVRRHLGRYKHVIGYSLVILLASATAAGAAQHLRIRSHDIVNGQVKTPDLAKGAVTSAKIADNSVTGKDIRESTLGTVPDAALLAGLGASAFSRSTELTITKGDARTIAPHGCLAVFGYGVGPDSAAGNLVTGYLTDVNGARIPSLNNLTVFLPGTVFETSQGGTIGFFEVCNPTDEGKDLPQGWKAVTKVLTVP